MHFTRGSVDKGLEEVTVTELELDDVGEGECAVVERVVLQLRRNLVRGTVEEG